MATADARVRVALLGATGAVGAEILAVLEERRFPVRELAVYASPDSEGEELEFRGDSLKLRRVRADEIAAADIVLSAAPGILPGLMTALGKTKARVVDSTGALEERVDVPLFLPGTALPPATRFVAVPRGVATGLALALTPFARADLLRAVSVVTLESASGAGIAGVGELTDHTVQVLNRMSGERADSEVFAQSLAFDCLPQIGELLPDGSTRDELRLQLVLRRLLGAPELPFAATRVRIPTLGGSLGAVHVELARPLAPGEALALWAKQTAVAILSDGELPTPRGSLGHDDAAVGRVRSAGSTLDFVVALNDLRLGAALGVVAAAEALSA